MTARSGRPTGGSPPRFAAASIHRTGVSLAGVTQPPRGFRISDADRERAAARLQKALAEGRITLDELEERLAVVYAARYAADLLPPFADLPAADAPAPAHPSPVPAGVPLVLRTGAGTVRRGGAWVVPARIQVQAGMGTVILDFCDTPVPHAVVEVDVTTTMGTVRLLVPDGATADADGVFSTWGTVRCTVTRTPVPGHPHFRVTGRTTMGTVVVRNRYRFAGHRW